MASYLQNASQNQQSPGYIYPSYYALNQQLQLNQPYPTAQNQTYSNQIQQQQQTPDYVYPPTNSNTTPPSSESKFKLRANLKKFQANLIQADQAIQNTTAIKNQAKNSNHSQQLPQRSARPSFCNTRVATQYFFNGCSVQDDRVYIGNTYVRTLTPNEIEQLGQFDQALSQYQDELNARTKQQMNQILQSYYQINVPNQNIQQDQSQHQNAPQPLNQPPLQAPQPPNVCTVIL
uniref:Pepsin inhibitor-3-like repeated domain-containing protein n=1 Tax=Acrobeloides nanus TaxID=290746 RepID=A0A914DYC7_9BILA